MAPLAVFLRDTGPVINTSGEADTWNWRKVAGDEDLILESWSQGFIVGALMLMSCITLANMRHHVILHKLIFLEQIMALSHGTFCFMDFIGYGWYLSTTAALLYLSYILHNVVAWLKVKPFFHGKSTIFKPRFVKWTTRIYTFSLACTVPSILFQISDNFRFFNGYGGWYTKVRPYEPLMRDPWWVFCSFILFYVISKSYGMGVIQVIKRSPRFGILFVSIILALLFTALDIVASIHSFIGSTDGINPFWKLSLVFKCLTDAILLDDFKTELKRLNLKRMKRDEKRRESTALVLGDEYALDSDNEADPHYSNPAANKYMNGHAYRLSVSNHSREKSNGNSNIEEPEEVEEVNFLQALDTHPSQLSSDRNSRRSSGQRHQVCRGGTPATRLPKLFAAIKPGRKSKKSADEDASPNEGLFTPLGGGSGNKKQKKRSRDAGDIAPDEVTCGDDALSQAKREQERTIAELTAGKNNTTTSKTTGLRPSNAAREECFLGNSSSMSSSLDTQSNSNDAQPANSEYLPADSMLKGLSTQPPRNSSATTDMGSVSTSSVMERRSNATPHRGSISTAKNTADLIRQHVQQQRKSSPSGDFWNDLHETNEGRSSKQHQS